MLVGVTRRLMIELVGLMRVMRLFEGIGMGERVVGRKSRRRRSVNGVTTPGELMEGRYIGVRVTISGKVRVGVGGERGNIRVRVRG
jgi:hypothetical protein